MASRLTPRARAAALFPLAALAVHDGFYRLGAGHGRPAGAAGHGYLAVLEPAAGVLGALVVAALVARLIRAWRLGDGGEPAFRGLRLWAAASLGLLGVFAVQETLEAALGGGHALALLGHHGWIAVLLAAAAGGVLTLFLRGARAVVAAVARRGARRRTTARAAIPPRRRPAPAVRPRVAPLALSAAGRAPPSVAVPL
jgi:hypothetical protein